MRPFSHTLSFYGLLSGLLIAGLVAVWWQTERPQAVSAVNVAATAKCDVYKDSRQFQCYKDYLGSIMDKSGAPAALAELDRLNRANPYAQSQCHQLAHTVGRAAYEHYGSVAKAAAYGKESCWSGYYHGIMEAYMAKFDDKTLLAKMPSICTPDPKKQYSFSYYNCVHGLGHGVTIRFNNDIFKALPYCDALKTNYDRQSCYGGVYMQNIIVDGVSHRSVDLRDDDPVYPCDAVDEQHKPACYLMVTSNVLQKNGYDYAAAFATCDQVEANYVATCYVSMGRDISGNGLLDPAFVVSHCNLGALAHRQDCYVGAALNAVYDQHGPAKADALCARTPAAYQTACRDARNQAASSL